jgi:hypothetical protein
MGALSSRQLLWGGCALSAFGALIVSRGGTGPGLLLLAIGAAMIIQRLFAS